MLSKEEYLRFWIHQAESDWEVVEALFTIKKNSQSLFWGHLVLEKLCKAIWIRDNNENILPKSHNLIYLLSQTTIKLDDEQKEFFLTTNRFQIEGRYPEYINEIETICNDEFTKTNLEKINFYRKWLQEILQ